MDTTPHGVGPRYVVGPAARVPPAHAAVDHRGGGRATTVNE
ncbi:hypothetical protein [Promicromonospora soli]|nr:hypothetical protein [Promicromonospora soli]